MSTLKKDKFLEKKTVETVICIGGLLLTHDFPNKECLWQSRGLIRV